jgi:hypothetical protein
MKGYAGRGCKQFGFTDDAPDLQPTLGADDTDETTDRRNTSLYEYRG